MEFDFELVHSAQPEHSTGPRGAFHLFCHFCKWQSFDVPQDNDLSLLFWKRRNRIGQESHPFMPAHFGTGTFESTRKDMFEARARVLDRRTELVDVYFAPYIPLVGLQVLFGDADQVVDQNAA